ncbi:MAG: DUF3306 domain-containing protein [Candidatus Thiodiazotropha sp.]
MKSEDSPEITAEQSGSFYNRWSERKQAARQLPQERDGEVAEELPPGDEDMPALESLDDSSDYSGFLSPRVSDELRQLALRKLFHSAAFNVCDGLDDYADDFTSFEKLGDIMTADLRHRLEQEARKSEAADLAAEGDDEAVADRAVETAANEGGDDSVSPPAAAAHTHSSDEAAS